MISGCVGPFSGLIKWHPKLNSPSFSIEQPNPIEPTTMIAKIVVHGNVSHSVAPLIPSSYWQSQFSEGHFEERFELPREARLSEMWVDFSTRQRNIRIIFPCPIRGCFDDDDDADDSEPSTTKPAPADKTADGSLS